MEYLLDFLKDTVPLVRAQAIATLGEIGDKKISSYLIESLNDPAWEVRKEAAEGLMKIKEKKKREEAVSQVRTTVLEKLNPSGDFSTHKEFDIEYGDTFHMLRQLKVQL